MFLGKKIAKVVTTGILMWTILFSSLPAKAQGILETASLAGSSSVFVRRSRSKARKTSAVKRRRAPAKRTRKQRRVSRGKIVRQSRRVAKRNRKRRTTPKVTVEQFKEIDVKRISKKELSKILAGLAEYHLEKEEIQKAALAYEGALEGNPNNGDAKLGLSEVYTTLGDIALEADNFGKALKDYTRAIELDPKNASAFAGRGTVFSETDQNDKAKADFEMAKSLDNSLTNVFAQLAIIYYQEDNIEKANENMAVATADADDNAENQYFLGLIKYKLGRYQEAVSAFRKSISIDDENDDAHYFLGAALKALNEDDPNALKEFKRAVEIDPKASLAWFEVGVGLYNSEKYAEAVAAYQKSILTNRNHNEELRDRYYEAHANAAEAYRQLVDTSAGESERKKYLDLAISKYRVAVGRIKDDPDLYSNFGFVQGQRDQWSGAIDNFKKAAALKPDEISYANLGWVYYQAAQYDLKYNYKDRAKLKLQESRNALIKAVSQSPDMAAAQLNLGIIQNYLKEYNDAENTLERAVKLQKNWLPAMTALGVAYLNQDKNKDAIDQFEKVLKKDSDNPQVMYYLAVAEFKSGNLKEAVKIHKKVQKKNARLANRLNSIFSGARKPEVELS
ncbi:MAG: tetratricopeptide repeat protein [Pyrinomonadaceae bacterium]|nr:tetratricopeptide repeat protein [Pyrinomonadaceae bacterium]